MPATVEKVLGKPIVIITYHGHITVKDAKDVLADIGTLLDDYGAPLYKIINVNCDNAHASFDEVMMLTTLSSKGIRGSATDPNVFTTLVGQHVLIDLYVDAMQQDAFGAVDIPIFDSIEAAEHYVNERIIEGGAGV